MTDNDKPRSRREILAAAGGVLGGVAVGSLIGAEPAQAINGLPLLLGTTNTESTTTTIANAKAGQRGLSVHAQDTAVEGVSANGHGVTGSATAHDHYAVRGAHTAGGIGVYGTTDGDQAAVHGNNFGHGPGVTGQSTQATAIVGFSTAIFGVDGRGPSAGVYGEGTAPGAPGVLGESSQPGGVGVKGQVDGADGTGVLAASQNGTALQVDGVATFSRSGTVTIPFRAGAAEVRGVAIGPNTLVFATAQTVVAGVAVQGVHVDHANSVFDIYLTAAAPGDLVVAWFLVG